MKIAILQLARYGDIIMTWPLVRALKRQYPGADITMIVRESYREALTGLEEVDHCLLFKSRNLLEPLFESIVDFDVSTARLDQWMSCLESQNYDWIINLSFSPLSADICSFFEGRSKITGYSRYEDGSLRIHGHLSQYFYDQVGADRLSRIHLMEIYARMLHIQLLPEDYRLPDVPEFKVLRPYFTVHLGGSETHKVLDLKVLAKILSDMLSFEQRDVLLLGSSQEIERSDELLTYIPTHLHTRILNHIGKTKFIDLFSVLRNADFHFGGDSLPMQICMLTQTPVVLLSYPGTNFWETGPLVRGSLVLRYESASSVHPLEVVRFLESWFHGVQIENERVFVALGYQDATPAGSFAHQWSEWTWQDLYQDMLNELYFDQGERAYLHLNDLPIVRDGLQQLSDANSIILEMLRECDETSEGQRQLAHMAERIDHICRELGQYHPALEGIVRWTEGLKGQIQPGTFAQILRQSLKVYSKVQEKIDMMRMNGNIIESRIRADFEKENV